MNTIALTGSSRTQIGTNQVKKLRAEGQIPCVLYTAQGPKHFSAELNAIKKTIYTPEVYVVELSIDGAKHNAIITDSQFDPVHGNMLHVDFTEVREDRPIQIELPVKLTGQAPGVLAGGKLVQKLRKMRVSGLRKDLPASLDIDVSMLTLGRSLKVREISFNNLTINMAGDVPVATIEIPRALRQEQGPRN